MEYCALETSFWTPARSDAPLNCLTEALGGGEASMFSVCVPAALPRVGPVKALFALGGSRSASKRHESVAFTWSHCDGFPLPSMYGEVVARRLGPMASICIRARYAYESDAAGRLFHEAIGARMGRKTFEALVGAVQSLLSRPVQRTERERR